MTHIRVVTDSACDIPDSLLRQFDITVVPFKVGGAPAGAASLHQPTVQPPAIDDFVRVYRSMRETCDGVISLHTSSKLCDAYANASTAREAFSSIGQGGPFPVAVVDSLSMTMGLGWLVLMAARAALAGSDPASLVNVATRSAGQSHVAFYNERLDGLHANLRAPRLLSQGESLAPIKPLIHLDDGQFVVYERTRTRAKARDALYNFVEDFPKIGEIAIIHNGAQTDLEHLLTRVGAIYPRERVLVVQPGPATAAWLGPDALGVAVLEGEET